MKILAETKKILRKQVSPIIEFSFNNYNLYVFPGAISPEDILIKYTKIAAEFGHQSIFTGWWIFY